MTIARIFRFLAGLALLAVLVMAMAACEGDSPEPTAPPVQTPQLAPTPLVISVSTPVPTATRIPAPSSTPAPTLPTAAEILRQTTSSMEAVQSVHVEMDITTTIEEKDGFTAEIHLSGEFEQPDRTQFTMSLKSQGFTVEVEFISIGVESFIKNPLTGEWEANLDAADSFSDSLVSPAFETDLPADKAAQFELVGIESLDGESVYYLRSEVTGPDLVELMDDQSVSTAEGEVAYWIGVDDYLIRKIEIRAEQESERIGIDAGVDIVTNHSVIELSDYNGEVDIVAPEVEAPWWEGLDDTTEAYIPVNVGEAVEGSIDVEYEEVIYELEAAGTAGYLITMAPGTLPAADVTVFDSQGNDVGWGGVYEDGTEEPIELEVPFPETYYIVVSNYEGATGSYTLTITPLGDESG
ncbi:MAG: LppX_LprAFG lipoprotein [Chloroflexi bacterium]|nr:LppX_LprAFG lipoprotein [Chloroflexota bacterium]